MGVLRAVWGSTIGRYAVYALLAAGAWWGTSRHYIHVGKAQGQRQEAAAGAQQGLAVLEERRTAAVAQVADSKVKISLAQAQGQAAEKRADELAGQAQAYRIQRATVKAEIQQVAPGNLHRAIVEKLGRTGGDVDKPGYSYDEERGILGIMQEAPLVYHQNEALEGALSSLREDIGAVRQELLEVKKVQASKDQVLATYETVYPEIYNALARLNKKRAGKCLWIWSCGHGREIPFPNPTELTLP